MKILVTGSRDWTNRETIKRAILRYKSYSPIIIHGDAKGADTIAKEIALNLGLIAMGYPADWGTYGKQAGPIRNSFMLKDNPDIDLVLAFWKNKSKGTYDMIKKAKSKEIEVKIYEE